MILAPGLQCIGVGKRYGGSRETIALDGVSIKVGEGECYGLVGQNGAGKSTLIGILSGAIKPSAGTVEILGQKLTGRGPRESRDAGLAVVYQELTVIKTLSALDNAFLGQEQVRVSCLQRRMMVRRFSAVTESLGIQIDPFLLVRDASVAIAQLVEIVRAVLSDAKVILFDEPTTALSERERRRFDGIMASLRERRVTQVLISHNLEEVLKACDRVGVLRDGALVEERVASEWSEGELVRAMAGKGLSSRIKEMREKPNDNPKIVLSVDGLKLRRNSSPISLTLAEGEIVGLAGLMGSGRSALLKALAGDRPSGIGKLTINGTPCRWPTRVWQARRLGVGYLPEDRKQEGVLMERSAMESMCLAAYGDISTAGVIRPGRERSVGTAAASRCLVDVEKLGWRVSQLSGGTQQKLLIGRSMLQHPAVLLCDEPTKGVDVTARADIWSTLRDMCADGMTLLVASSQIEELLENCDRIVMMANGAIVGDLKVTENSQAEAVLKAMFEFSDSPAGTGSAASN